jgi:hypothetical protein
VWLEQLCTCFVSAKPWIQTPVPPPDQKKKDRMGTKIKNDEGLVFGQAPVFLVIVQSLKWNIQSDASFIQIKFFYKSMNYLKVK